MKSIGQPKSLIERLLIQPNQPLQAAQIADVLQEIYDKFHNDPNPAFINEVYDTLAKNFYLSLGVLDKKLIVFFFEQTKDFHEFINKQTRKQIIDNLSRVLEFGNHDAFVYKAVTALSTLITSDSLFFMKAIEGYRSKDKEVSKAAAKLIQILCKSVQTFVPIIIEQIEIPLVFPFLPYITSTPQGLEKATEMIIANMYPSLSYFDQVLQTSIDIIKELKIVPIQMFKQFLQLLNDSFSDSDLCNSLFDTICGFVPYLLASQKKQIAETILSYVNQCSDENHLKCPIKLLALLRITDESLVNLSVPDHETAIYLISLFPPLNAGDQAIQILDQFLLDKFTQSEAKQMMTYLGQMSNSMSDLSHSIVIEKLIPNLLSLNYQDEIAQMLMFISDPDCAALYGQISYSELKVIKPKLKAYTIRLCYLANVKPSKNINIEQVDALECAIALFQIGEYSRAATAMNLVPNNRLIEAFKVFTYGERFSFEKNRVKSSAAFQQAYNLFSLIPQTKYFQQLYSLTRYYYESVILQADLLYQVEQFGPIHDLILDLDELRVLLDKLPVASLLLHPEIDTVSYDMVNSFCNHARQIIQNIDDPTQFNELKEIEIIPPPAFMDQTVLIEISELQVINNNIKIEDPQMRNYYIEINGSLNQKCNLDLKYLIEVNYEFRGNKFASGLEAIENPLNYTVFIPISLDKLDDNRYHTITLLITLFAKDTKSRIYVIGQDKRFIQIEENQ